MRWAKIVRNLRDNTAFDLLVDGCVEIEAETFTVCDAVLDRLIGRGTTEYTELDELADAITNNA